jgi:methylphosphotriester-DNA--protein-cysteine methyltransferase
MMNLEMQVRQIVERTGQSPADVRKMLMAQYNLTPDQYAQANNTEIRGTLPGGGFMGQPG